MTRRIALFVASALIAGCVAQEEPTRTSPEREVIGTWVSFQLGGKDIGDYIARMTYVFNHDGSFTVLGEMTDGEVIKYEGTFRILPSVLEMTIKREGEEETERMPFHLEAGVLTVRDPELDSWVKFKRRDSAEPGDRH